MTLAGSGHVTVSYTIGSEGQGRVSSTYEDLRGEFFSWWWKSKVRVGVVEDRKKEFP